MERGWQRLAATIGLVLELRDGPRGRTHRAEGIVIALAISPDGRWLADADSGQTSVIRDQKADANRPGWSTRVRLKLWHSDPTARGWLPGTTATASC